MDDNFDWRTAMYGGDQDDNDAAVEITALPNPEPPPMVDPRDVVAMARTISGLKAKIAGMEREQRRLRNDVTRITSAFRKEHSEVWAALDSKVTLRGWE